jgi:transposase
MELSDDLRKRVLEAVVLDALSRNAVPNHFKVSIASAVRWVKQFERTGEILPKAPAAIAAPAASKLITTTS